MQINETEILFPLNASRNKTISRKDMLYLCIAGIVMLGIGIFVLIPQGGQIIDAILIPSSAKVPLSILLSIVGALILFGSIVALMELRPNNNSRLVRVNHDGFFFPHLLSTIVTWGEISTIAPYMQNYLGQHIAVLAIVPQDTEEILSRVFAERSRSFFSSFYAKINIAFYHRSRALSPLQIPQVLLPVSIDDFISLIQERFASELNEHRVAILEWQD